MFDFARTMVRNVFAILVASLLTTTTLLAQEKSAAPESTAEKLATTAPKVDAKTFNDWRVECYEPAINNLRCQMVQQLQHNQLKKNVMVITLAHSPKDKKDVMQYVLPLDFLLKPGVGIEVSSYKITAAVDRCAPEGCFIEGFAENKMIRAMRRTTKKGQITMMARTGQRVVIPFSLDGFSKAYKFMRETNLAFAKAQGNGGKKN